MVKDYRDYILGLSSADLLEEFLQFYTEISKHVQDLEAHNKWLESERIRLCRILEGDHSLSTSMRTAK